MVTFQSYEQALSPRPEGGLGQETGLRKETPARLERPRDPILGSLGQVRGLRAFTHKTEMIRPMSIYPMEE